MAADALTPGVHAGSSASSFMRAGEVLPNGTSSAPLSSAGEDHAGAEGAAGSSHGDEADVDDGGAAASSKFILGNARVSPTGGASHGDGACSWLPPFDGAGAAFCCTSSKLIFGN